MITFLLVAFGGALGALGRYYTGMLLLERFGGGFPYGTLAVNALGGFFVLFFITLFIDRLSIDPLWKLFVVTGFLGGFTTFSAFTYETLTMMLEGEYVKGALNFFLNNFFAFLFGMFGFLSAKAI